MTQEELKLALEALHKGKVACEWGQAHDHVQQIVQAMESIKKALAKPEQEPVATDWERIARVQNAKLRAMCEEKGGFEKLCEIMDKYEKTTPPQRTWVGLTWEEIDECFKITPDQYLPAQIYRRIEAKLKQKNGFAEEKNNA